MEASQIYILISIVVLVILALFVFLVRKNKKPIRLTPLTGIAFGFILAGILFGGDNKWFGYGLFGAAIVLSVIDIILKLKKK